QHLGHCRCALRCRRQRSEIRAALGHLLALLQTHGQYTRVSSAIPGSIAAEIHAFDGYLADVRGLSPVTRSVRARHLRDLLLHRFGTEPVRPDALEAADVVHFMDHCTAGWAPAS